MVTTMTDLDRMMRDAETRSEAEAQQLAEFDALQGDAQLKPTGIQLNAQSRPMTIYERRTGEPRTLPSIYAREALKKKYTAKNGPELEGQLVFSLRPTVPYVLGSVKCLLHPSQPLREMYNSWGLPVCKSEHFPSEHEVERHMASDHNTAWLRLKEIDDRKRRDEDRALQVSAIETQNAILVGLAKQMPSPSVSQLTSAPRARSAKQLASDERLRRRKS